MSLENIINEVELFEIIKNEKVIPSSTLSIQHVNNAIHNITNAKIKKPPQTGWKCVSKSHKSPLLYLNNQFQSMSLKVFYDRID